MYSATLSNIFSHLDEHYTFSSMKVRSVEHLDQQHVFCAGQAGGGFKLSALLDGDQPGTGNDLT